MKLETGNSEPVTRNAQPVTRNTKHQTQNTKHKTMYFPYLIAYMAAGFVISLVTFLWALNAGQFKDQKRARFLPLEGEPEMAHVRAPRHYRIKVFILFALACSGLVATAAVIAYTVINGG